MSRDEQWMRHALHLAEKGWGRTHPNPMVGCVIVRDEKIISEGWHEISGGPHAENMAISRAKAEDLKGATLYVTLEPCSTTGRTGACVNRIIHAGIARVVMGTLDPNPQHQGRAVGVLRDVGIEVSVGCCEGQARRLNWIFNHQIVHREPLVAAKTAVTLDGKIATRTGHSQWITGEIARQDVMRWRALFPVIAVGAGTVVADNPSLTIRQAGAEVRSPVRLVLDRRGILAEKWQDYSLFTDSFAEQTIWVTSETVARLHSKNQTHRFSVWELPDSQVQDAATIWLEILQRVWQSGWTGVWVEGGSHTLSTLLESRKLHALWYYQAPIFLADSQAPSWIQGAAPSVLQQGFSLTDTERLFLGTDSLIRGLVCYPGLHS